jgi:hypothetical protein
MPAGADLFESLFAALILILVYLLLFTRFDMKLLFSDTILTGGDSASWYQVLSTLKNDFLPKGRLFGFSQANFFGYLEGQHYFILPFLSAALLGFVTPLTVALKIATVAGGFALPATMFIAATSISGRKRAGALASASSLLFLFNESYTIFGGNWLSTFAGEFCFSWAIALLPLFVASVAADMGDHHRKGLLSGLLLGLIGLSHFFVFMPAFFLPFFSAFTALPRLIRKGKGRYRASSRGDAETTLRILVTYGFAILVMAFWLLPMAATRKWAQPISIIWNFSSLKDFARQTLAWIWVPLALVFLAAFFSGKSSRGDRRFLGLILYALAACAFLFLAAPGLGMPDIRFIPSALLFCALGASVLGENFLSRLGRGESGFFGSFIPSLAVLVLAASACASAAAMARNAPAWFRWNYSGYEAKAEWPALEALGGTYRGSPDDGRFLWEKQDQRDNSDFGSERGFENLPLFTGHPTSEGIHYGSSMMARAATYLQSSYSPNPVDPEAERIYSEIDPQSWPARFSLLNARYIVTHSNEIKAMFAAHPDFALDSGKGKFAVYRYKDYPGSYIEVLGDSSLSIVEEGAGGFRADYYRFFREYELYGYPFVSAEFADDKLRTLTEASGGPWERYDEYRNVALARAAVAGLGSSGSAASGIAASGPAGAAPRQDTIRNEHVDNFGISFDTTAPGVPHFIKISYAPGGKSRGGEKIYPVSPGFMLIVPETGHVEMKYGRTGWEVVGIFLSVLGLPAAFAFWRVRPGRRFPWKPLLGLAFAVFAGAAIFLALQTSAGYPALAKSVGEARRLNLGVTEQREKALDLVEPWATTENLDRFDNKLAFDAFRIKALALLRQGRTVEASALVDMLRARYPHTRALKSLPDLQ